MSENEKSPKQKATEVWKRPEAWVGVGMVFVLLAAVFAVIGFVMNFYRNLFLLGWDAYESFARWVSWVSGG